jgi:shikimate dehydrogenase
MHNAALAVMAAENSAFAQWHYFRFDIPPDQLETALKLLHRKRFHGVNLTVPHKVIAYDLIKAIDPSARPVGAVNTLRWHPDGYEGFNTDGYGLTRGLSDDLQVNLRGTDVILLGAGGAGRGAAIECVAQGCRSLCIGNRTRQRAEELSALLRQIDPAADVRIFDPDAPPSDLPADALVINATSAGLKPTDPQPIDLSSLPGTPKIFDMIYNPPETALLGSARSRGFAFANGFSMLIYQGARSLEIWSGEKIPVEAMFRGAREGMVAN